MPPVEEVLPHVYLCNVLKTFANGRILINVPSPDGSTFNSLKKKKKNYVLLKIASGEGEILSLLRKCFGEFPNGDNMMHGKCFNR